MSRVYRGERNRATGDCVVERIEDNGRTTRLPLHLEISNHSPAGFNWGYGGSGPAQLALALIVDATGDPDAALTWHQPLKWALIGRIQADGWNLSSEMVRDIVRFWEDNCE